MKCENEYCIYNKKRRCCFETVEINSHGMCEDCIVISLDAKFLEAQKERQRQEMNRRMEGAYG